MSIFKCFTSLPKKEAEYKINSMRDFLKSPEYHKVSKNFYTINDELTKIANKLLSIIGEDSGSN